MILADGLLLYRSRSGLNRSRLRSEYVLKSYVVGADIRGDAVVAA